MNQSTVIQSTLAVQIFDGTQRTTHTLNPADHINSGGVGDVYRFQVAGKPAQCIKIYKSARSDVKAKLVAMLQQPPKQLNANVAGRNHVQFAWPVALVEDMRGQCIGFVMPEVDFKTTQSLQPYFVPKAARQKLSAEARSLNGRLKLARNIAALMADLHSQGHAFIDFKDQNVRIYPDLCMAAFIDTDGYRIENKSGAVFPGMETTPTFNSPESAKGERKTLTQQHDDFVMALVLFQILNFGIHPFQGIPSTTNQSINFDLDDNIIQQNYPYGARKHPLIQPKQESVHDSWPSKTQALFEQTFLNPDPARRGRAGEWTRHLDELIAHEMRACEKYPQDIEHVHFKGKPCHMCKLIDAGVGQANIQAPASAMGKISPVLTSPHPVANSIAGNAAITTQPQSSGSAALPPPVKRSKLRWILPLTIAIAVVWIALAFAAESSRPAPAIPSAPAPAPAPSLKSDAAPNRLLTKNDYPGAVASFADQLALFQRFSRDQDGEIGNLIQLAISATSQEEFLRGSKELFTKPSDAWDILSGKVASDTAGANVKATRYDSLARAEYDAVGLTQQVLINQAQAVATMPTNPVLLTNLAYYLLAISPTDALAASIAAMHLQARAGQPIRIYSLEVIAAAAVRLTSENQKAAESILMAGVWAAQDLDRRCVQMNRYAVIYPGLQTSTAPAKELAQKILVANGRELGSCNA